MTAPMNIGTLVGYLKLDDTGVDIGVKNATSKIKGFAKSGAAEGAKAGTAIGKAAGDKTVEAFGKSEGKLVSKTKSMFSNVGKMALTTLGGISVASVLTKGWDRLTGIENAQAKLRGLGHDAATVQTIMDNALASVKGTAFGLAEAATTAAGAVAAQIQPGEELETVLKAVANSAAAAGVDMTTMGGIFNKVASLTKAQNDVLQQVANMGLPIYQALADQFGVTADAVFDMATRGEIGFAQFEAAMKSASGTVADELGQTTTGAISNLGAAMSRLGADLLSDVMPAIKGVAQGGTWLADEWGKIPGPVKAATAAMAGYVALSKLGGLAKLSEWLLLTRVRVSELGDAFKSGGIKGGFANLTSGAGGLLKAIGPQAGIAGGIMLLTEVYRGWQRSVHLTDDVLETHTGLVQSLTDVYRDLGDGVDEVARKQAWEAISENFKDVVKWAKDSGISTHELVDAFLGLPSGAEVRDKLSAWRDGLQEAIPPEFISNAQSALAVTGTMNTSMRNSVETVRLMEAQVSSFLDVQADSIQANRDADEAIRGANAATALAANYTGKAKAEYLQMGIAQGRVTVSTGEASDALMRYLGTLDGQARAASRAAQNQAEVSRAAQQTSRAVLDTAAAMEENRAKAHDLSGALGDVARALAELSGRTPTVEEATRDFNGAMSDLEEKVGKGKGGLDLLSASMVDANGVIDTSTKTGQDWYDMLTKAGQAAQDTALAQASLAGETGGTDAAAKAARESLAAQREEFIKSATQMGYTKQMAKELADAYFGLPRDIETIVRGKPNFDDVDAKIQRLADQTVWVNVAGRMTQSAIPGQRGTVGGPRAARATGGWISGPGTSTSDSILARLSDGEYVVNARSAGKYGALLEAINRAPGFASGGLVAPTAQALSGLPGPSYGPIQSTALAALAEYAALVGTTGDAAKDSAAALKTANQALKDLTKSQNQAAADRERNAERTRRSEDEAVKAAEDRLAEVKKETAAKIADAKTSKDKATRIESATKDIDAAEAALDKARRQRRERLGDLERTMNRANKAEEKKLRTAEKAAALAEKENAAAQQRSQAVSNLVAATAQLRKEQGDLAGKLDDTNEALAGARTALDNLVQASQSMRDSISQGYLGDSAISQFGGSVPVENMLQMMEGQLGQSRGISSALMSLAGRGLNGTMLESVARMGLAGAGLASTLAGATDAQLRQFNSLQSQLKTVADATGTVVADAIYANDIKIAERQVAAIEDQAARIEAKLTAIADRLEESMALGLQGLSTDVRQLDGTVTRTGAKTAESIGRDITKAIRSAQTTGL